MNSRSRLLFSGRFGFFARSGIFSQKKDGTGKDGTSDAGSEYEKLSEGAQGKLNGGEAETDSKNAETDNQQYSYTSAAWAGAAAVGRMASSAVLTSWNYFRDTRGEAEADSKKAETDNEQYSYTSAAWAGAAAVGTMASSAVSTSWNYCRDTRALQYLNLESILIFLQSTKNISVETATYLFDILMATFFSTFADSRIRFLVLQSLELLLGFPPGTTLFIEKGVIPFLKAAINAVYQEEDSKSATVLLRIVYSIKEYAPQLLASSVPLFLLLPDVLDFQNLKTIMHFSQHVIEYFQPNDWKKILLWCSPFIGYDSMKSFADILGIDEKDLCLDKNKINGEALEVTSENKEIIVALLRASVVTWLRKGNKKKSKL